MQQTSKLSMHQNYLEGLLKQIMGPTSSISHSGGLHGGREFAFLTSSQAMQLLAWGLALRTTVLKPSYSKCSVWTSSLT